MEQALEYFGVVTGLLYLYLEIRQHKAMWVVGFVSSLAYVFVFFFSRFYAVMALNIYYVLISIYGFLLWSGSWRKDAEEEASAGEGIVYSRIRLPLAFGCAFVGGALFAAIYFILNSYTDSPVAVGDAFTTSLGIVATWMLARRIIEHWICWVVVNLVSAYLYYSQGLYPTMFLFICYTVLAVVGYMNWKKKGVRIV